MATSDRTVVAAFGELVDLSADRLNEIDQLVGDGDFGSNLRGGLRLTLQSAEQAALSDLAEVFLDHVGGTSGPLLGLLFANLASAEADGRGVAAGAAAGLRAIQDVGGAQPGDRTLVDSLAPAVDALRDGSGFGDAAQASVDAALSTAQLRPRAGRSSYLAEKAVGVPDPGAIGLALFFVALARARGDDVPVPQF